MDNRTNQAKYSSYLTLEELKLITDFRAFKPDVKELFIGTFHMTAQTQINEMQSNVVSFRKL